MTLASLKLISAGAGSGKTYRLTQELTDLLTAGEVRPSGIIATTFTKKAAAELKDRVRKKLLEQGLSQEANELSNALIGTVHGLGVKLLRRFAYEAGVSPQVDIIAEGDEQRLFNLSLASVLDVDRIHAIEGLCERLALSRNGEKYDWRNDILRLVEVIRANNFSREVIAESRDKSWTSLQEYLPPRRADLSGEQYRNRLLIALDETAAALENNEADATQKTATAARNLRAYHLRLRRDGHLPWIDLAKLGRYQKEVGTKSRALVERLVELGTLHAKLSGFHDDLKHYQDYLFDLAAAALEEYDFYKKQRGRIDYTDMEVLVLRLLDEPTVRATLSRELDLLMVDEFQDTSPIQLALFLRLSQLATRSVWVGDPKQSIYGFRGAEPRLMAAVMDANGPVRPENIQQNNWRSRPDLVHACNDLFEKAFPEFTPETVSLDPVRSAGSETANLRHWHFELAGKGRYSKVWLRKVTAKAVRELLADPPLIQPKGESEERRLRPGDVAVLCRSNYTCQAFADALADQGIAATINRNGLLKTAEATLILACLRYVLNGGDTLSVAEILLLGSRLSLDGIIDDRLDFLLRDREERGHWAAENELITRLRQLRSETKEFAASEVLNLLLERLDLRRIIVAWGEGEQRLANVDELRRLAKNYEDHCHQQHRAASLGGLLLHLDQLLRDDQDQQGASERPDAVNVLTYHRSKGLEWPAVVCFDLDQDLRADVWGREIVATTAAVDLDQPLRGRWLKYWVNPYARLQGVPWVETLRESKWQKQKTEAAGAEEARLLYVGFTRARDLLILPTGKKGASWVDRVYARGGHQTTVLEPATTETPFDWRGHEVDKRTQVWREEGNIAASPPTPQPIPFMTGQRSGRGEHQPRLTTEEWLLENYPVDRHETLSYFDWPKVELATNQKWFAAVVSGFLHVDHSTDADDLRRERAEELLSAFAPGGEIDSDQLLAAAEAFRAQITAGFTVHHHHPYGLTVNERRHERRIDWLLESEDNIIIILDCNLSEIAFQRTVGTLLAEARLLAENLPTGFGKPLSWAGLHHPPSGRILKFKL